MFNLPPKTGQLGVMLALFKPLTGMLRYRILSSAQIIDIADHLNMVEAEICQDFVN